VAGAADARAAANDLDNIMGGQAHWLIDNEHAGYQVSGFRTRVTTPKARLIIIIHLESSFFVVFPL
jgi:hypothetical protein